MVLRCRNELMGQSKPEDFRKRQGKALERDSVCFFFLSPSKAAGFDFQKEAGIDFQACSSYAQDFFFFNSRSRRVGYLQLKIAKDSLSP